MADPKDVMIDKAYAALDPLDFPYSWRDVLGVDRASAKGVEKEVLGTLAREYPGASLGSSSGLTQTGKVADFLYRTHENPSPIAEAPRPLEYFDAIRDEAERHTPEDTIPKITRRPPMASEGRGSPGEMARMAEEAAYERGDEAGIRINRSTKLPAPDIMTDHNAGRAYIAKWWDTYAPDLTRLHPDIPAEELKARFQWSLDYINELKRVAGPGAKELLKYLGQYGLMATDFLMLPDEMLDEVMRGYDPAISDAPA